MNYQFKDTTGKVIHTIELSEEIDVSQRLRFALAEAVTNEVDLTGVDLRDTDLKGLELECGKFKHANFSGAELQAVSFSAADLCDAIFRHANLTGANLTHTDLSRADFTAAVLTSVNFNCTTAEQTVFDHADIESFRQDFIAEVLKLPTELEGLRAKIIAGEIDGSTYSGTCRCLAGSLVSEFASYELHYGDVIGDYRVNYDSPRETWFTLIKPGHTPENHAPSAKALDWLDEAIRMRDHIIKHMGSPT